MKQPTTNKYEAQIEQWTDLVWHIVNKIKGRLPFSVSEEELYAAGMFGLMRAARSYDETQGAQFKTYAYHRVRGAILDDLRRMDFLPRSMRDKLLGLSSNFFAKASRLKLFNLRNFLTLIATLFCILYKLYDN